MADLTDVENTLVTLAANAVYPNGTSQPSVAGVDVRIYPGWPLPANLDADLAAGKANVSIYPSPQEHVTTRFDKQYQQLSMNAATLTATVNNAGTTVTIGGAASTPQSVMVIVNGTGYAYAVQANDTLISIATNIAALIPGANSAGAVITISGAHSLIARIGVTGTSIREVKRQERVFWIITWAPTNIIRASIASAIDVVFAATERLSLPDGYYARLRPMGTRESDDPQKAHLYRRDLMYAVEYATTQTETDYAITDPITNITSGQTGLITP